MDIVFDRNSKLEWISLPTLLVSCDVRKSYFFVIYLLLGTRLLGLISFDYGFVSVVFMQLLCRIWSGFFQLASWFPCVCVSFAVVLVWIQFRMKVTSIGIFMVYGSVHVVCNVWQAQWYLQFANMRILFLRWGIGGWVWLSIWMALYAD